MKTALIPPDFAATAQALAMSPAIVSGDHVFFTGITGSAPDGTMPATAEAQVNAVFAKARALLATVDLGLDAIVEMTSYHIGLRGHFETFDAIRRATFTAPYPAWTAVEVAGLRRDGALVEVRFVARIAP
jgi:enamine deaminase RidA (YjgF/YER057c/UK114 family)